MKQKLIRIPWILVIVFSISSGLVACSIFRESLPASAPAPVSTVQVTADKIAQAMQEDHFYSDYRGLTLVLSGTAASIGQEGDQWVVELQTTGTTKVFCDLGAQAPTLHARDQITVEAAAGDADRGDSSVILKNCRILP